MPFIADKFKMLSETLSMIEEKLGLLKFVQYSLFILVMYVAFNFSSIIENVMKMQTELAKKEHEKRLLMRDDLMTELNPLLVELRSGTGASRVLYFEYHNSTENFVGIPFKFANLVLSNQIYGCPSYDISKKNNIIINRGIDSTNEFYSKHPEIHDFFSSQDGSNLQVFINLPGVNSPMGIIILEWMDEKQKSKEDWEDIKDKINSEITRINALISKYTP